MSNPIVSISADRPDVIINIKVSGADLPDGGSDGQVLTKQGGKAAWADPPAGDGSVKSVNGNLPDGNGNVVVLPELPSPEDIPQFEGDSELPYDKVLRAALVLSPEGDLVPGWELVHPAGLGMGGGNPGSDDKLEQISDLIGSGQPGQVFTTGEKGAGWENPEVTKEDIDALSEEKADQFTVGEGLQMSADRVLSAVGGGGSEGAYELIETITLDEDVSFYVWENEVAYKKILLLIECPAITGYVAATNKATYIALGEALNMATIVARVGELPHTTYTTYTSVALECANGRLFCKADTSRNNQYNNSIGYVGSYLQNGVVSREEIKSFIIGNLNDTLYAGLKIQIWGARANA